MSGARHWEQDKDSTVYVGNIDERVIDPLIWELMIQAGPVINVHLPKDRVTQNHQGYGFVEFGGEEDAEYAVKIMNGVRLFGKAIRVNKANADKRGPEGGGGAQQGVGAELFVGNLDSFVDEKVLYDTFIRFGPLLGVPKVARDDSTNLSKGYAFISYASFSASDEAIENMHGQILMNKEVTVQYAYKKDGKGERHGDAAERALADQAKKHGVEIAIPAMPAALVMSNNPPSVPGYPNSGDFNGMPARPPPVQSPFPPGGYPPFPPPTPHQPGFHAYPPPTPQQAGFNPFPPTMPPQANYHAMPPPVMTGLLPGAPPSMPGPPPGMPPGMPRPFNPSPLQAPPPGAGLPPRPPPSAGGFR